MSRRLMPWSEGLARDRLQRADRARHGRRVYRARRLSKRRERRRPRWFRVNQQRAARIRHPYMADARKLADEASGKYRVGTLISAIRKPAATTCAMISWSNTKPSEFALKFTVSSTSRRNAR